MTSKPSKPESLAAKADSPPRIIGGKLRGRKLVYAGDPRTRPMKDRVRESLFNMLGTAVEGKHAVDLFAGTGALGLEAISRSAASATLVERHFPTAEIVRQNAAALGVELQCNVLPANTLLWPQRWPELPTATPWVVFCSPPYDLYVQNLDEMLALVNGLMERAPLASMVCVEADERFDFGTLADAQRWDVRAYPPAVVGIWEKIAG